MFFIIYKVKLNFFEQYKVEKEKLWPWEENYSEFIAKLKKLSKNVFINILISISFTLLVCYTSKLENKYEKSNFPSTLEIIIQLVFFLFCEDFAFYFVHRFLHNPLIYSKCHKVHHEFKQTVSIVSIYAHPLEFLVGDILLVIIGPLILMKKVHVATLILWSILRSFETADGHSGYDFPWSPFRLFPFSGTAEYHNYHHTHNVGNFTSIFTWLDSCFGTNKVFFFFIIELIFIFK